MSTLYVTTIQTPLHWEDAAANRSMLAPKIAAAPAGSLVVLPEMFTTGFSMQAAALAEP
ncbi:MAG: nitrilase family protein, partial [Bacteroidetes bacterium]